MDSDISRAFHALEYQRSVNLPYKDAAATLAFHARSPEELSNWLDMLGMRKHLLKETQAPGEPT